MNFDYLVSAEVTDVGRKRKQNEDSLLRLPDAGIFCVADGMGGVVGGDVASQAVVQALQKEFQTSGDSFAFAGSVEKVKLALNNASQWIKNRADEMGITGTGTTAVIMAFDSKQPSRALILHAGDSRAYRFRRGKLTQLTQDHSVAAIAGVSNEQILPSIFRGVVTRAVGLEREVALDQTAVEVEPNDLFIICSDGLTKMVPDALLEKMIHDNEQTPLEALARKLVNQANDSGGFDNVSVLLIRVAGHLPDDLSFDEEGDRATDMITPGTHDTSVTSPMVQTEDKKTGETQASDDAPTADKFSPHRSQKRWLVAAAVAVFLSVVGILVYPKQNVKNTPKVVADVEQVKAQVQAAVRATLLSGEWGLLETELNPMIVQMGEGVTNVEEVAMYKKWSGEWRQVAESERSAENLFTEFQNAISTCLQKLGGSLELSPIAWSQENNSGAATMYCAQKYSLQQWLRQELEQFCDDRLKQAIALDSGVIATMDWLQPFSAKRNYGMREALQDMEAHTMAVETWMNNAQLDKWPLQAAQMDDGILAELDSETQREDELWAIFYETIRYLNFQAAGWDKIEDPAMQQRIQDLGALRVRIINVRAQYKDNIREWRLHEGKDDILKFVKLVNETFPQTG